MQLIVSWKNLDYPDLLVLCRGKKLYTSGFVYTRELDSEHAPILALKQILILFYFLKKYFPDGVPVMHKVWCLKNIWKIDQSDDWFCSSAIFKGGGTLSELDFSQEVPDSRWCVCTCLTRQCGTCNDQASSVSCTNTFQERLLTQTQFF